MKKGDDILNRITILFLAICSIITAFISWIFDLFVSGCRFTASESYPGELTFDEEIIFFISQNIIFLILLIIIVFPLKRLLKNKITSKESNFHIYIIFILSLVIFAIYRYVNIFYEFSIL